MMWLVGILVTVIVVLGLALYAIVTQPVRPSGAPTPDEAKITNDVEQKAARIDEASTLRKEEILHEDRQSLFARARAKLRRK